ncbi:MAG: hypothetical protein ICV84_08290 [Flavisolibacter sp.]|nr:hypothetical protein [Flavisolibacter sp.]
MKSLFMLLIATFATLAISAQKNKVTPTNTNPAVTYVQYTCPMHPEVVSNEPGKCPKCNMDLTISNAEQKNKGAKQTYTCPMHSEVVSDHAGICAKCGEKLVIDRRGSKQTKTVYTCSMHPEVASTKPGKCPVCNMELKEVKTKVKQG